MGCDVDVLFVDVLSAHGFAAILIRRHACHDVVGLRELGLDFGLCALAGCEADSQEKCEKTNHRLEFPS